MKIGYFILIALLSIQTMFGQTKKEIRKQKKAEKEASIQKLIENKAYTFTVRSASTYDGHRINQLTDFDLTLKNDSVLAYLPYFGRAFVADFPSGGGIELETNIMDFKQEESKKGYIISFEAEDSKKRNYDFILTVGKSGYADLSVRPENKSMISYDGIIHKIEE